MSAKDDRYNCSEKGRARWRSYAARRRAHEIEHENAILDQVAARLASDPSWVPTREQAATIDAMFERSIRRDEAREKDEAWRPSADDIRRHAEWEQEEWRALLAPCAHTARA